MTTALAALAEGLEELAVGIVEISEDLARIAAEDPDKFGLPKIVTNRIETLEQENSDLRAALHEITGVTLAEAARVIARRALGYGSVANG